VHYSLFSINLCFLHLNVNNKSTLNSKLIRFVNMCFKPCMSSNRMWIRCKSHFRTFSSQLIIIRDICCTRTTCLLQKNKYINTAVLYINCTSYYFIIEKHMMPHLAKKRINDLTGIATVSWTNVRILFAQFWSEMIIKIIHVLKKLQNVNV